MTVFEGVEDFIIAESLGVNTSSDFSEGVVEIS